MKDLDSWSSRATSAFDFEALGAVECAGKGRFGALPEELPFDRLPVEFTIKASRGRPPRDL